MRFWEMLAAILVALPLLAGGASAQTADPTPERLALARRMLEISRSPESEASNLRLSTYLLRTQLWTTLAFSGGAPELDDEQLYESLSAGAATGARQGREFLVEAYARELTDEEMNAVIAFHDSPEGRVENAALSQYLDDVLTLLEGEDPSQAEQMAPYVPSAAGAAFSESLGGRAMQRAQGSESIRIANIDMAQAQIAAAQADYCAHVTCGADHVEMFRMVGAMVAFDRYAREHAMFGRIASDLFTDPEVVALARAACSGDAAAVAAAVSAGADPNTIGGEGTGPGGVRQMVTPLLWAIDCGSVEGVEALLAAGADPNQREEWGSTPVTVAAGNANSAILKSLLGHGGDPNAHEERNTALEIALRLSVDLARIEGRPANEVWANWEALITAGADLARVAPDGEPLIATAAYWQQWRKIYWLIDQGWSGDPVDLGRTLELAETRIERGLSMVPPEDLEALARVRTELISRGVKFPIGPLSELSQDARGFYIQP